MDLYAIHQKERYMLNNGILVVHVVINCMLNPLHPMGSASIIHLVDHLFGGIPMLHMCSIRPALLIAHISIVYSGCEKVTSVTITTYLIAGGAGLVVIIIIALVVRRRYQKRNDALLVNNQQEGSTSSPYQQQGGTTGGAYVVAPSAPSPSGAYGYPQQPPQAYAQPYHTS
jgi:hypothetical protein